MVDPAPYLPCRGVSQESGLLVCSGRPAYCWGGFVPRIVHLSLGFLIGHGGRQMITAPIMIVCLRHGQSFIALRGKVVWVPWQHGRPHLCAVLEVLWYQHVLLDMVYRLRACSLNLAISRVKKSLMFRTRNAVVICLSV